MLEFNQRLQQQQSMQMSAPQGQPLYQQHQQQSQQPSPAAQYAPLPTTANSTHPIPTMAPLLPRPRPAAAVQLQHPHPQWFCEDDFEPNPVYNPHKSASNIVHKNSTTCTASCVGNPVTQIGNAHGPQAPVHSSYTQPGHPYMYNTTTTSSGSSPYNPPIPSQISFQASNNTSSSAASVPSHLAAANALTALSSGSGSINISNSIFETKASTALSTCGSSATATATTTVTPPPPSSQKNPKNTIVVTMDRRKQFLVFLKILFHQLKTTGATHLHQQAQRCVRECNNKNRLGMPAFMPLHEAAESRLLRLVGPRHWNRSVQYLNLHLKLQCQKLNQRRQQQTRNNEPPQQPCHPNSNHNSYALIPSPSPLPVPI